MGRIKEDKQDDFPWASISLSVRGWVAESLVPVVIYPSKLGSGEIFKRR